MSGSNGNGKAPTKPAPGRRGRGRPPQNAPVIDLAKAWKLRVVNRLSFSEIASALGCSKSAVQARLKSLHAILPNPEEVQAYEDVEPYLLTASKARLLASLMDGDAIEKASLNNRAFAFTQVSKQERLTKGQSTANLGVFGKLIMEAHAGLAADPRIGPPKDATRADQHGSTPHGG